MNVLPDKTLPDLPSELIRLAIKDLEIAEKSSRYTVNMGYFHTPKRTWYGRRVCLVCLAGAVMAGTLDVSIDLELEPGAFVDSDVRDKLRALDCFHDGDILGGLTDMHVDVPKNLEHWYVVPMHSNDPEGFKVTLLTMAHDLESVGL